MSARNELKSIPLVPVWAVGATIAAVFFLIRPSVKSENLIQDPAGALQSMKSSAEDVVTLPLESPAAESEHGEAIGEITWSDRRQRGFIRLGGVYANDPNNAQFQLWLFDPARGSFPVSGGVFDLKYEQDDQSNELIFPITASLPVHRPKAFAITKEKPGGVVISDFKKVVAVAAQVGG